MLRGLVIAIALVCAAISLAPAQAAPGSTGTISVTPGVDSRHFTVSGCGFKFDRGPHLYSGVYVQGPTENVITEQTVIAFDAVVGSDGCFSTAVAIDGSYAAGTYDVYVTYRTKPVSNVVSVTLD